MEPQDLLELTPKKDVLFIIGDWSAKVGSQETPGVTGKFGLGIRWDLPDPGIESRSSAWQADYLPTEPPGKPH